MKAEPPFDFAEVVRGLNDRGIRFVLIGRQAVRLYGSTALSRDYDLWLPAAQRAAAFDYLEGELGYETSDSRDGRRPIVHVHAGLGQMDLIFVSTIRNQEGQELRFDEVWARATVRSDDEAGLSLRIPSIDDLIALKKCRLPHARDEEDIQYLLVRKALDRESGDR